MENDPLNSPGCLLLLNIAEAIEDRFRSDKRLNLDFELPSLLLVI